MADVAALDFHRSTAAAVAVLLNCKNLTLHSRRSDFAAVAAASALHAEGCAATAARFDITAAAADGRAAAAMATAIGLDSVLVATLPAAISAGLCARRRRNRQCGDARGKE